TAIDRMPGLRLSPEKQPETTSQRFPMNIAIDIRPMLEQRRAGVSLYTANLVNALIARDAFTHTLFLNALGRPIPKDAPPATAHVRHAFTCFPNKLLNLSMSLLNAPTIESLCGGADAVYLPN